METVQTRPMHVYFPSRRRDPLKPRRSTDLATSLHFLLVQFRRMLLRELLDAREDEQAHDGKHKHRPSRRTMGPHRGGDFFPSGSVEEIHLLLPYPTRIGNSLCRASLRARLELLELLGQERFHDLSRRSLEPFRQQMGKGDPNGQNAPQHLQEPGPRRLAEHGHEKGNLQVDLHHGLSEHSRPEKGPERHQKMTAAHAAQVKGEVGIR
mmetsp:Transcript_4108/g.25894  ORF Transcript_4108/g.25894 Transcript_4108/m.25894 type:complete len:209 (-) Transcript_4108:805-1431(-)